MAAFRLLLACCVLLVFSLTSASLPEPGKLTMEFSKYDTFLGFPKALYKGAIISVKGHCKSKNSNTPKIIISWKLHYTQCADHFAGVKDDNGLRYIWERYKRYEITGEDIVTCDGKFIHLTDQSSQAEYIPPNNNDTQADADVDTAKSKKGKDEVNKDVDNKKRKELGNKQHDEKKGNDRKNGNEIKISTTAGKKRQKKIDLKQSKKGENGGQTGGIDENHTQKSDGNDFGSNNVQHQDTSSDKSQHPKASKAGKPNERQARSAEMKEDMLKTLLRVKRDEDTDEESKNEPPQETAKLETNKKQKSVSLKKNKGKKGTKDGEADAVAAPASDAKEKKESTKVSPKRSKKSSVIAKANRDGIYILIVTVKEGADQEAEMSFNLELNVAMESKSGYLSATDWPLLPFYGIMSLLYLFYGIIWLIVSACQWRDLLRIQFWIGGVIALGMLEKAVFYSEYNNINNTGITTPSLVVFAEIVSVAKRTLARMLVIIVSMGFGIVKPRLGKSLHRVLGVGALYFIIGIVEGCLRSLSSKADPSKEQLIAGIPLAVLDAAICWWIFMSLVQTTRTLRIRRNVIKLSLYRHFTNTLIFAVLASVAYMIWSIKTHKFAECMTDWSELWLDDAFWHFLFSIILLVIMILWRPTANNQRYAFTPIVDFDDDEEDNVTLSEAFEGMKMRNTRTEVIVNGDHKKKAEDDLKWVEENIPSSAADTVLPSVLDSDEELMTTKFEMSKME